MAFLAELSSKKTGFSSSVPQTKKPRKNNLSKFVLQ
jgi:hypothetical protein